MRGVAGVCATMPLPSVENGACPQPTPPGQPLTKPGMVAPASLWADTLPGQLLTPARRIAATPAPSPLKPMGADVGKPLDLDSDEDDSAQQLCTMLKNFALLQNPTSTPKPPRAAQSLASDLSLHHNSGSSGSVLDYSDVGPTPFPTPIAFGDAHADTGLSWVSPSPKQTDRSRYIDAETPLSSFIEVLSPTKSKHDVAGGLNLSVDEDDEDANVGSEWARTADLDNVDDANITDAACPVKCLFDVMQNDAEADMPPLIPLEDAAAGGAAAHAQDAADMADGAGSHSSRSSGVTTGGSQQSQGEYLPAHAVLGASASGAGGFSPYAYGPGGAHPAHPMSGSPGMHAHAHMHAHSPGPMPPPGFRGGHPHPAHHPHAAHMMLPPHPHPHPHHAGMPPPPGHHAVHPAAAMHAAGSRHPHDLPPPTRMLSPHDPPPLMDAGKALPPHPGMMPVVAPAGVAPPSHPAHNCVHVMVEFKASRMVKFNCPPPLSALPKGTYVVVVADRGEHIGRLRKDITPYPKQLPGAPPQDLGMVVRVASEAELQELHRHKALEEKALMVCRQKVEEAGVQMELVYAEYQFDLKKITFYYKSDARQDFRDLIRDLFKIFRARIWMEKIRE